jgi:hypothetical protein
MNADRKAEILELLRGRDLVDVAEVLAEQARELSLALARKAEEARASTDAGMRAMARGINNQSSALGALAMHTLHGVHVAASFEPEGRR